MYYLTENNILLSYADNKYDDNCKYTDIITQAELDEDKQKVIVVNNELELNPDYEAEKLAEAKQNKYQEANLGAVEYLEGGNALYAFEQSGNTYHIEATDGNIAKIGLKATSLLIQQDYTTTFPWNTKEDINIQLNAFEGKAIAEGLGAIQDEVWTVKFPEYIDEIEQAQTVEEVEAIVIDYESEE